MFLCFEQCAMLPVQGFAFMELGLDYLARVNLWRDLVGDWPPIHTL